MKHQLAFLVCCLSVQASLARIWYVDPSITSPLIVVSIPAAIDSASAHDTIMVRGSHWEQFAIDKPLTLYGEGYSDITGYKTNIFGRIDVEADSVTISGFRIQQFGASFAIRIYQGPVSNLTVERCRIEGQVSLSTAAIGHVTFRNNVFQKYTGSGSVDIPSANIDTLIFENNVFDDINFTSVITAAGTNTFIIRNNLFLDLVPISSVLDNDCSAFLYNNIFYNRAPQGCPSCTYSYNLFWNDDIGYDTLITGNGNLNHVNPGLVNYDGGVFDFNDDYSLSDTSQCIGAGWNSVDIGITGGYYPYHIGEGPKIPLVTYANIGSSADEENPVYYLQFDSRARTDVFSPGTYVSNNDSVHLVQAEYWIDSIPIPGTGTLVSLTATDTLFYIDSIPGLQLDTGAHTISVRTRDDRGNWGFVFSDETRNELYDVAIKQTASYYIRQGSKMKLEVEVRNRGTTDLAEQYLFIRSTRFFELQLKSEIDSVDGVFVGTTRKGVMLSNDEYLVPIWLGRLAAHSINQQDFYLTYPVVGPHELIGLSTELVGDAGSAYQLAYDNGISDSLFHASLFCSALAATVVKLSDTLALDTMNYISIVDTIRAWANSNDELFSGILPLNLLSKSFLERVYGSTPDSAVIDQFNSAILNSFIRKTFNGGRVGTGGSGMATSGDRDASPCDCTTQLNFAGVATHAPLEPVSDYKISSACQERCECRCIGGVLHRDDKPHVAVDIYYDPDWPGPVPPPTGNCRSEVKAMLGGIAISYVDVANGLGVKVVSTVNGTVVTLYYHHLCLIYVADGSSVSPGTPLGLLGDTGDATGPHLHIEAEDINGDSIAPSCYHDLWSEYSFGESASRNKKCRQPIQGLCFQEEFYECGAAYEFAVGRSCGINWEETKNSSCGEGLTSWDPNDKVGNIGRGAQRYILPTDELHYGIFFENVDSATIAAQVIHIVDTLDVTKVDASTFHFESITAGEMLIVLPDSVQLQVLDTVYMKEPVNGCFVHVQASFDQVTGIADVQLTSLDTFPPYAPVDGLWEGLLPPDTTDFDGNGMVTFRVMPILTIPDGTVIYNTAHIIFDSNPAIQTGTWFNTIDGEAPTSFVHALPATTNDTSFIVHWEGSDDWSGVLDFDIYAKLSGDTAFTKWLSRTSLDSAVFVGVWDSTYQFYSIAYDSVGNMENKLPLVEASTTLHEIITGVDYIVNSEDLRIYPNPTNGKLTVEAAIREGEDLSIDIFDLLGQRVSSFIVTGPSGTYLRREIDLGDQADGVYLLRLAGSEEGTPRKFVLKRN